MTRTVRLGMLTPSSNTVIEPVCAGIIAELAEVTCHFGRFRVTETSLGAAAQVQFANEPKVTAARLLADAKVDVICWNGTSGGWLGIDTDRKLCEEIFAATGIPATSSVLALQDLLRGWGVRRLGLVSPYLGEIQDLVIATFGNLGYECVAEQHLGIRDNDAFSTVARDVIAGMVRNVARQQPDTIVTFCTNLRAAPLVAQLERETGIPIFDSTAAGVWGALHRVGIDSSGITGWGRMFSDPH